MPFRIARFELRFQLSEIIAPCDVDADVMKQFDEGIHLFRIRRVVFGKFVHALDHAVAKLVVGQFRPADAKNAGQ